MFFAFILYLASSYIIVMLAEIQAGQRTHAKQSAPQTTYNIFLNQAVPYYLRFANKVAFLF